MSNKPPSNPPSKQAQAQQPAQQPSQPISVTVDPESASTNFRWYFTVADQTFDLQTTLRGKLSPIQVDAHIDMICDALANISNLGGIAKGNGHATTTVTHSPTDSLPTAEQADTGLPVEPEYVPPEPEKIGNIAFDTQKLTVEESTRDGQTKRLYKIGGGKYMKYGVRVWDEVLLDVGIKLDKLQVKEYPMPGYTAFCDTNNEGHPTKVVRLTKKA